MARSFQTKFSTKGYRFKRRLGYFIFDTVKAMLLIVAIFTAGALMIYIYNYMISFPYFRIQETIVRGCKELTEKDILSLVNVKPAQSLLAINADAISRRVKENPWVKNVFIGRELPNRLVIEVRERKAAALIKMSDTMFLMDGDGIVFKKMESGDDTDLPILTGCYKDGAIEPELLRKSLELLRYLSTTKEFPDINSVSEVHIDEMTGFSIFTDTGLCLHLGFDCYENKLKRLVPVMVDLEKRNLKTVYLNIDLSDPIKITVKRNNMLGPSEPIAPAGSKNKYRT